VVEKLIRKQKELMQKVPHTLRPGSVLLMAASIRIMDALLRFLNSTGHKPWRPVPLEPLVQDLLLDALKCRVGTLSYIHHRPVDSSPIEHAPGYDLYSRQLISAFGIIEETVEYINSIAGKDDRAHRLEEVVDILFFYLEQLVLAGFTWEEVKREYHRKWKVNMERYRCAEKGIWDWDKRSKEVL